MNLKNCIVTMHVLILSAIGAGAQSGKTKFVDEMYFPESWTKPVVTVTNGGGMVVTPSVPTGLKKTDIGSVLDVRGSSIAKNENIPIIERLALLGYQELKDEFRFIYISEEDSPGGLFVQAEIKQKDRTSKLVYGVGDVIKLISQTYKIKEIKRKAETAPDVEEDAGLEKPDLGEKTEPAKNEQGEDYIVLQDGSGKSFSVPLNKNFFPLVYKVELGDIYDKKIFFAPCPGSIKIQDSNGNARETYYLVSIQNDTLLVRDSKGREYKFRKTQLK